MPCATCGVLVKEDQMMLHICGLKQNDFTDADLENKRCKICNASFSSMTAIVDHMRVAHIERKVTKLLVCYDGYLIFVVLAYGRPVPMPQVRAAV